MTVVELLARWFGLSVQDIEAVLKAAVAQVPDLAGVVEKFRSGLGEIDAASLASLAAALPTEARAILLGHLDPRDHPSDSA